MRASRDPDSDESGPFSRQSKATEGKLIRPRYLGTPAIDPPATPSFYAFSYTVPSENRMGRSFVAAGSGEAREGGPSYLFALPLGMLVMADNTVQAAP